MWASASSPSSSSNSQFLQDFYSRKLLLNTPLLHASQGKAGMAAAAAVVVAPPPITTSGGSSHHSSSDPTTGQGSIDSNIVMILSALLCALICALALNSMVRCALRCSSRAAIESGSGGLPRLANTGIKKKVLKTFPIVTYSPGMELPGKLDTECIICLSEFGPGERLRFLPKCNHGFHVRCIDKWLMSHSSCPTCRQCLINTCQKIEGSRGEGNSSQVLSVPQGSVAPLQPEGLIRNYRGVC